MNVFDELSWRGLIAQSTDPAALADHLNNGQVTFYIGFDPTAPSLHHGNLVQLIVARHLQQAGHQPILLVGGSTGLIGDPKESGERAMRDQSTVATWASAITEQVKRFVSFDGPNPPIVVNNLDWTASLSTLDFLRDIGKHFPINRMLARDVVRNRLESGISYTEFSYVLLQALDYLELFRRHNATVQFGGSDQWGNLTAGCELVRRVEGARVHAFATPLITRADGTKFGKSESGAVWLNRDLLSPYAFYQVLRNAEDAKVAEYLRVYTTRTEAEIAELAELTQTAPQRRAAQQVLAADLTDLVHGAPERQAVEQAAAAVFGDGDLSGLPAATIAEVFADIGAQRVGPELPSLVDALVTTKISSSKTAARRLIDEGGAYVNNERVADPQAVLSSANLINQRYVLLRGGRRKVSGIELIRP